jgi:hypothetical protein
MSVALSKELIPIFQLHTAKLHSHLYGSQDFQKLLSIFLFKEAASKKPILEIQSLPRSTWHLGLSSSF